MIIYIFLKESMKKQFVIYKDSKNLKTLVYICYQKNNPIFDPTEAIGPVVKFGEYAEP